MTNATQLLAGIEQGDPSAADELLPLVYDELRNLAAARMSRESPGQTLQATACGRTAGSVIRVNRDSVLLACAQFEVRHGNLPEAERRLKKSARILQGFYFYDRCNYLFDRIADPDRQKQDDRLMRAVSRERTGSIGDSVRWRPERSLESAQVFWCSVVFCLRTGIDGVLRASFNWELSRGDGPDGCPTPHRVTTIFPAHRSSLAFREAGLAIQEAGKCRS
ncbi:MAG: hypothetical protein KDB00_07565 [Planctomycetales bacterium]|nr:hypothetical protein [Planctomycetales bacterium]